MPRQYNPYQQTLQPNMPQQRMPAQPPIKKTNWVLYVITVVISFLVLLFLTGSLVLSINFIPLTSFTGVYVLISIMSLVVGLIAGFILNKIAKTNKHFLLGNLIASILSAVIISTYLFVQKRTAEQLAALGTGDSEVAGSLNLSGMFGPAPDAIWVGVLMIVFFNIVPLILFFKRARENLRT